MGNTNSAFIAAHQFCGRCGRVLGGSTTHSIVCSHCGLSAYNNPVAAVSGLAVNDKGELLLCKRKKDPYKGTWDVPGGFIEIRESAEDALRRELKEELGVTVASLKYLNSYFDVYDDRDTLCLFYIVHLEPGEITAADDITATQWFSLSNVPQDMGFPSIYQGIAEFAQLHKNP